MLAPEGLTQVIVNLGTAAIVLPFAYWVWRSHRPKEPPPPVVVSRPVTPQPSFQTAAWEVMQEQLSLRLREALDGLDDPEPEVETPPIFFKPGEPQTFYEYGSQESIVELLDTSIQALKRDQQALDPQIFLGWPGSGKTLLAKVVAHELQMRAEDYGQDPPVFIEVFPADIGDVAALDEVLRRVQRASSAVVFIDEIHGLSGVHSHKLYELLENRRYKFQGEDFPVHLPNVTLLAATTDYGQLHGALQRRWIKHYFEPATEQQLLEFLERRGRAALPGTPEALGLIVDRTKISGQPWEAVELFRLATTQAMAQSQDQVTLANVEWVLENQGIDQLGLRKIDRQVIDALLTRKRTMRSGEVIYGASEADTCLLARVDKSEYRETIRPKLMVRGLLQMRSGIGQALTPKALQLYGPQASTV